MYSKDDISRIILEFQSSDFVNLKRGTKKSLLQVNLKWNNLMSSTKVLTYWITHCKDKNNLHILDNGKDLTKDGFIEVYDAGHKILVK